LLNALKDVQISSEVADARAQSPASDRLRFATLLHFATSWTRCNQLDNQLGNRLYCVNGVLVDIVITSSVVSLHFLWQMSWGNMDLYNTLISL